MRERTEQGQPAPQAGEAADTSEAVRLVRDWPAPAAIAVPQEYGRLLRLLAGDDSTALERRQQVLASLRLVAA